MILSKNRYTYLQINYHKKYLIINCQINTKEVHIMCKKVVATIL
jgi:hypothetical protein